MTHEPIYAMRVLALACLLLAAAAAGARAQEIVELGDRSKPCNEVAACFNRLHPAIPMAAPNVGVTAILPLDVVPACGTDRALRGEPPAAARQAPATISP